MRHHLHTFAKHPIVAIGLLTLVSMGGLSLWGVFPTQESSTSTVAVVPTPRPVYNTEPVPTPEIPADALPLFPYIEITDSCGPQFEGTCVNMRSGPGETYPIVSKLRTGVVLKVADTVTTQGGKQWYRIAQDSYLLYPERVMSDWFVSADVATLLYDDGDHRIEKGQVATTTKHITVDISEQMLYAYNGEELFMQQSISTGLEFTPTPRGTFTVFKITPSRYMQGPILEVSDQYYDLPGVPWNLYFTSGGAVIHGAYWHNNFGQKWSHGCVNLPVDKAKELYMWADLGTKVTVQD